MSLTDVRLTRQVDAELARLHPTEATRWEIDPDGLGSCRIASPVEPCERCGHRVYLVLVDGDPRWFRLGEVLRADTLFPAVTQILHECGDGDAWSVEAGLFAEQTLADWACAS